MMSLITIAFLTLIVCGINTVHHQERETEGMTTYLHNEYNVVYPR